jgi:hypothetical protein
LRGFDNLFNINKSKIKKPTPSVPLLKKGEVKSSFASTSDEKIIIHSSHEL